MTFQQLQTQVSYILDDLSFGYFTTAQVQFWLNNAQREVQKRLLQTPGNWYVRRVQTPTVQGQSDYLLPNDFLKIHRTCIVLSGTPPNEVLNPLEPMTIQEQDFFPPGIGCPTAHYETQNIMTLVPSPDTSGQLLRIFYSYLVSDMVNPTDVPDIPLQYHEYLGLLAAHDGFIKDQRDPSPILGKMAYYETMMKEDAQQRTVERGRKIVTTQGDSYASVF